MNIRTNDFNVHIFLIQNINLNIFLHLLYFLKKENRWMYQMKYSNLRNCVKNHDLQKWKSFYTNWFSLKGKFRINETLLSTIFSNRGKNGIKIPITRFCHDSDSIGSNNFSSLFSFHEGIESWKVSCETATLLQFYFILLMNYGGGNLAKPRLESNGGNLSLRFGWLIVLVDRNYEHRPKRHARPVKTEPIDRSIVEQQNHYLPRAFKHKVNCFSSFKWDCSVGSHRVAPVPRHRGKTCTLHSIW